MAADTLLMLTTSRAIWKYAHARHRSCSVTLLIAHHALTDQTPCIAYIAVYHITLIIQSCHVFRYAERGRCRVCTESYGILYTQRYVF